MTGYLNSLWHGSCLTPPEQTLLNNIWLGRYSSTGSLNFSYSPVGGIYMAATDVVADASGNMYLTGYYEQNVTFNQVVLNSAGYADLFVAKITPAGTVLWAIDNGNTDYDFSYSIALDPSNNIFICGYFTASIQFGSTTLTAYNGINTDFYIAKLNDVMTGTGVQGNMDHSLHVYPNPVSGSELRVRTELRSGNLISIYDLTGRCMFSQGISVNTNEYVLPIAALDAGLYFVQVNSANEKRTMKFSVQR